MIPDSPANPPEPVEPDRSPIKEARRQADAAKHPRTPPTVDRIGSYKILEVLGEGGMGTVYLAEQTQPLRRVALKVIKPGMDSKAVIARFEAEEQALALMNHPNVAQVFDAGTTEQGRPYFVMEHVAGVPITEHCDRHKLSIAQRLELFVQVCEAVQHAHQKGVIHRDIKPSNILVAFKDERSVPKIIDFGVAKAIGYRLSEGTVFTQQGQLIGTPEYMSPEQAEMTAQNVDTRTDIYSLGVLLYELLTGTLPFDPKSLHHAAFDEIRRIIREVEPPTPSTRVSSMITRVDGNSTMAADNRMADPRTLIRGLRGDLDWITIKALEKDRARRYASAFGLAEDIRRHLNHEPVVAGPPSAAYRFKKLVRRNRGLATGLVAVMIVMVVSTVTSLRFAIQAKRQAAIAAAVNNFLNNDLLAAVAPDKQGREVTMREVLDTASRAIEGKFEGEPLMEASIRMTLGNTYLSLGRFDLAETHLRKGLRLRDSELGEEHPDTLDSVETLGVLYGLQGRYAEARPLFERTLELKRRLLGAENPETLSCMDSLGVLNLKIGRYDVAERLIAQALELRRRVLGEKHRRTLTSMNNLALVYKEMGRYDKAELLFVRSLELYRDVLGEQHPHTLMSMNNLSALYLTQRRYEEAEPLLVEALEVSRGVLGEEHPRTLFCMNNLSSLYSRQQRYEEAEPLLLRTLELRERVLGKKHRSTLTTRNNLGSLYWNQGRYDKAESVWEQSLEQCRRFLGEDHPLTLDSMHHLATLYGARGRYDESEDMFVRALAYRRRVLGAEHPNTLETSSAFGAMLRDRGELERAEIMLRETVKKFQATQGDGDVNTGIARSHLGACLRKMGRYADAERELAEAHRVLAAALPGTHRRMIEVIERLVSLYDSWDKPAEAAEWRERLPAKTPSNR